MNYATFIPSHQDDSKIIKQRSNNIDKYVGENGYISLKSDYFSIEKYYYDNSSKTLYRTCSRPTYDDDAIMPIFEVCYDNHILQLNGIAID